jgi:hypothetical protein
MGMPSWTARAGLQLQAALQALRGGELMTAQEAALDAVLLIHRLRHSNG